MQQFPLAGVLFLFLVVVVFRQKAKEPMPNVLRTHLQV
jgi:hypothetical protein